MPSTHTSLSFHTVWSTKDRRNLIDASWKPRLHAFMGGIVRDLGGVALEVGGVSDHVHVLMSLKATHAMSDVMRELKQRSSEWVHQELRVPIFQWQEGYFAVSVSPSVRDSVRRYIANQEAHHTRETYMDEYLRFLREAEIEFDERYVW